MVPTGLSMFHRSGIKLDCFKVILTSMFSRTYTIGLWCAWCSIWCTGCSIRHTQWIHMMPFKVPFLICLDMSSHEKYTCCYCFHPQFTHDIYRTTSYTMHMPCFHDLHNTHNVIYEVHNVVYNVHNVPYSFRCDL